MISISPMTLGGMRRVKLYHGSLTGIQGGIRADYNQESAPFSDFGLGFYTSLERNTAQNLLFPKEPKEYKKQILSPSPGYVDPFLYTLSADFSSVQGVEFSGVTWALFIAYNNNMLKQDVCPEFYDSISNFLDHIDVICGPLSDDKTFLTKKLFINNQMTFEGFNMALSYFNAGTQYTFRTQNAIDKISIVKTERLSAEKCCELALEYEKTKPAKKKTENKIIEKYKHEGHKLSELIEYINHQRIVFPKWNEAKEILRTWRQKDVQSDRQPRDYAFRSARESF